MGLISRVSSRTYREMNFTSENCNIFTYDESNLHSNAENWGQHDANKSDFDRRVCESWNRIRDETEAFAFRFTREQCKYKIIEGENGMDGPMVCQLNLLR